MRTTKQIMEFIENLGYDVRHSNHTLSYIHVMMPVTVAFHIGHLHQLDKDQIIKIINKNSITMDHKRFMGIVEGHTDDKGQPLTENKLNV